MAAKTVGKVVAGITATVVILLLILGIHIYVVTRPHANAKTVALARIDIKQKIDENQAGAIENWLAQQTGVEHVVLNRKTNIIVFSFYPVKVNATGLTENLKTNFNIKAERFIPSAKQLASGCPAMSGGFSGKLYSFFTHKF